jgi:DNA-binding transcriptional ArsR family regulator
MKGKRGRYGSKEFTPEEKKAISRFALALRDRKWKWEQVLALCEEAGYAVPDATLREWVSHAREGTTPISEEKGSGRPRSLDDKYVAVIIGWFLQCEDEGEKTSQRDFLYAAFNNFGVCISQPTVSRHLDENWLSLKLFGRRSIKSSLGRAETSRLFYEELLKLDREGIWNYPLGNIWFIDVTTTSRRYELPKSWGRDGGKQRKLISKVPKFTDSLVTLVNGLGQQRGPYVFSRNKQFLKDSPEWPEIVKFCRQHKLDPSEIFVEFDGDSAYYKEDAYMIDKVLSDSRPWEGHVFLSDKGTAFRPKGESIILDNGADMHFSLNPPIHGKFNINDAHLHPVGKRPWVAMRKDDDPEWKQTLQLAYCISTVSADSTRRAVERNYFLNEPKSLPAVDERLWGPVSVTKEDCEKRHAYCLKMYQEFLDEGNFIDTSPPPEVPEQLQSALDGAYWENY